MASKSKCSRKRKPTASRRAARPSIGTSSISLRGSPDACRSGQGSSRCPTLRRLIEGGSMTAVPVTAEIAKRAAHLGWNDLPDDLIERTKQCLLDWFAVTIPGAQEELTEILVAEALEDGAKGPSTLVGRSEKV